MDEPLARNLRVLRAERGIGLQDAEDLTGVTRETIAALERGQRGVYSVTLRKLAEGYNVSLAELLADHARLVAPKAEAPDQGQQEEGSFVSRVAYWHPYDDFEEATERALESLRAVRERLDNSGFGSDARLALLDDGKVMEVVVAIRRRRSMDSAWQLLGFSPTEGESVTWSGGIVTEDPSEFDPAAALRRDSESNHV
jgi:transcriptional regulator with XRE-family HTH domain